MSGEVTVSEAVGFASDDAELDTFCAIEYPRLVRALDLYTGDRAIAEDLAQEALVRACQRWRRVRTLQSPGGWTYRVAVNLANSHLRRRRAEVRANRRSIDGGSAQTESLHQAADRLAVREALAALTPPQREVIVLRYYLGRSANEAAELMGMPASTVRSHTKRALDALRRDLGEELVDMEVEA